MSHKKNYLLSFLRLFVQFIFFSFCFYLLCIVVGGYIWKVNTSSTQNSVEEKIPIYITSNGFHTDIVVPIRKELDFFKTLKKDSAANTYFEHDYQWLSVGWGDKNFYNESYNNNFPSVATCINAIFLPSKTLMHLEFYKNKLREDKNCKKITLKKEEYEALLQHIEESFRTVEDASANKRFVRLPQKGYYNSDYFFEAEGSYHLFYTCNSWTNEGLKNAKQKTALFAPLAHTVLYHLE
ncbi:TIGR02117 family protein [Bernardetia sp.]|uniref:TIGR02117 family protein n=1 Tax=Bernardetia sp. TaxID=1937974 RepID=UPI0025C3B2D1|nr:TIGR02117 family protein [Bernardetia sp.]